jgi:D-arabinose 1-dehydrogenase-like Zn-dependent alcohol dehydrogenase
MLTSKGFGFGQAPTSTDGLCRYEVLRGIVINGPKAVGSIVALNPRSQTAIELLALGKIRLIEEQVEAENINRAVLAAPPLKRGKKNGRI